LDRWFSRSPNFGNERKDRLKFGGIFCSANSLYDKEYQLLPRRIPQQVPDRLRHQGRLGHLVIAQPFRSHQEVQHRFVDQDRVNRLVLRFAKTTPALAFAGCTARRIIAAA